MAENNGGEYWRRIGGDGGSMAKILYLCGKLAFPTANRSTIMNIKRLAILGSTGSIGTQTLDVVRNYSENYALSVLAAGHRVDELIAQAREFRPALAIIADESLYGRLHEALAPLGIATACGPQALAEAVTRDDVDMVLTATVGFSGLIPTIRAINAGKDIALANKETLVVPRRAA